MKFLAAMMLLFFALSTKAQRRQTSSKPVVGIPQASAPSAGPMLTAAQSLRGLKSVSVSIDGFDSDSVRIRNTLVARLEDDGITILPDGQYPNLYLSHESAGSTFSVGYSTHRVSGTYIALVILRLFPLDGGQAEASTYRSYRFAASLNPPEQSMLNNVIDDFFSDWEKGNPLLPKTPTHDLRDGDLVSQSMFDLNPNNDYQDLLKPFCCWTDDFEAQYRKEISRVFGDAGYREVLCEYKSQPYSIWTYFWFKKSPPESAELQMKYKPSIFTANGVAPVDACPANLAAAIEAKKMMKGEPPKIMR